MSARRSSPSSSAASADFPLHVLRDYALLADGERGVVVGPRGEHAWMCAPAWDSDAVFGALIGGPGCYAVTPVETPFVWGGHYEEGTLIWRNRWVTGSQIIECREALALLLADPHTAVVLRRVEAMDGPTRAHAILDPRAGVRTLRSRSAPSARRGVDGAMRAPARALDRSGRRSRSPRWRP